MSLGGGIRGQSESEAVVNHNYNYWPRQTNECQFFFKLHPLRKTFEIKKKYKCWWIGQAAVSNVALLYVTNPYDNYSTTNLIKFNLNNHNEPHTKATRLHGQQKYLEM